MVVNPVRIGFALIALTFILSMGVIIFALFDTPVGDKISDILFFILKVVASISFAYVSIGLLITIFTC